MTSLYDWLLANGHEGKLPKDKERGLYCNPDYGDLELALEADHDILQFNRANALWLEALKQIPYENHCKDCCCAKSWKALGITEYTGKSIPEHIEELKQALKQIEAPK